MPSLERWSSQQEDGDSDERGRERDEQLIPYCLEELYITGCPKMVCLPHLLPSLKALSISAGNEMLLRSVANYTSFAKLSITGFPGLTYLPEELGPNHASLHSLEIRDCQILMSLSIQLQNLLAFKTLIIEECVNLVLSLPDGLQQQWCPLNSSCENHTSPLGDGIVYCGNFESSSSDRLQNLTSLVFKDCPNALTSPDFLEKLKSLGILKISRCSDMMNLPESMKKLTSLTYLEIANCPTIMCLPKSVGDLMLLRSLWIIECPGTMTMPEGLQCLTNLQELYVRGCPVLKLRLRCNNSEDWHKVVHVPNIRLDGTNPRDFLGLIIQV